MCEDFASIIALRSFRIRGSLGPPTFAEVEAVISIFARVTSRRGEVGRKYSEVANQF